MGESREYHQEAIFPEQKLVPLSTTDKDTPDTSNPGDIISAIFEKYPVDLKETKILESWDLDIVNAPYPPYKAPGYDTLLNEVVSGYQFTMCMSPEEEKEKTFEFFSGKLVSEVIFFIDYFRAKFDYNLSKIIGNKEEISLTYIESLDIIILQGKNSGKSFNLPTIILSPKNKTALLLEMTELPLPSHKNLTAKGLKQLQEKAKEEQRETKRNVWEYTDT